ncbi:MAG: rhomboid family intramembrane serine protease [Gammaproteobacteria bacterium]|nr:rhomboid family intramembrane serine protease [Gammaproteobacteria bacterium]
MDPAHSIDLVSCPAREQCAELALVLESQAVPSIVRWDGRAWVLSVDAADAAFARRQLSAYAAESKRTAQSKPELKGIGNPWPGIFFYLITIIGFALIAPELVFGIEWLARGRMDAGMMFAGEWWRPVTALSLHADAAHLLGNAFFGSLFAYSVARYWGGGFGWLAIVLCGTFGNVANGFLSGADHRSIGASTAVFAALGLLAAYCWRRGFPAFASARERSAPIVAGIGLLAYMGTGGVNTDIGAHLLGFVVGFGGGLLGARFGVPTGRRAQISSGLAAGAIFAAAWLAAVL